MTSIGIMDYTGCMLLVVGLAIGVWGNEKVRMLPFWVSVGATVAAVIFVIVMRVLKFSGYDPERGLALAHKGSMIFAYIFIACLAAGVCMIFNREKRNTGLKIGGVAFLPLATTFVLGEIADLIEKLIR